MHADIYTYMRKRLVPVSASLEPISTSRNLGAKTPGVSRTYILGWLAI